MRELTVCTVLTRAFVLFVALLACSACAGGKGGPASEPALPADPVARKAIQELSSLPLPAGADKTQWEQLKAELARVLEARADGNLRAVSAPPKGAGSASHLAYFQTSATLRWRYYNPGDYDQNGVVSVSDLTPLGIHFLEESPFGAGTSWPEDDIGAVIDGNSDGIINIGDVTTIGLNFGARVDGYHVYASELESSAPQLPDSPNGPGSDWLDTVGLDTTTVATVRRELTVQVVPTETVQYFWVRPFDDQQDGAASNSVTVIDPPNIAPNAQLTPVGETATLAHIVWDASASDDLDGTVATYEWDFDGDGEFEFDSEGEAALDSYYYAAGTYTVGVKVTDNEGASTTASNNVVITQLQDWHVNQALETIKNFDVGDEINGIGEGPAPQMVSAAGKPGLLFLRINELPETGDLTRTLEFQRALDTNGETWAEPQVLHTITPAEFDSGQAHDASMILDAQGRPIVCLYQSRIESVQPSNRVVHNSLFLQAATPSGETWSLPKVVNTFNTYGNGDSEGILFSASELVLISGKPTVLGVMEDWPSSSDEPLGLTTASDSSGNSWSAPVVSGLGLSGNYASLVAVAGGSPALAKVTGEDLLYYRALDNGLQTWDSISLVDEHEKATAAELLEVAGIPAVAYYDEATDDLRFRRALNAAGSAWASPVVLDPRAKGVGSAGVISGRPGVLYRDRVTDKLSWVAANDQLGTRWGKPCELDQTLDDTEALTVNFSADLVDVGGLPTLPVRGADSPDADDAPEQRWRIGILRFY